MTSEEKAPATPLEVTTYIGKVLRNKRALLDQLHVADLRARELRREATKAEARSWLSQEGSIPARKYKMQNDPAVDAARAQADVAEAAMWHLRGLIAQCGDEIEGARTAAATLRAEFSVLGMSGEGS